MKKSRLLGAVCATVFSFASLSSHSAAVSGQGTWETTLLGRDLDGNLATAEAYYDTTLNITWLKNANAGAGSVFDDGTSTTDGGMTWASAISWAASLDINGISNWRLPTMTDTNAPGCNTAFVGTDCGYNVQTGSAATTVYSELASLWYDTLGNIGEYNTAGSQFPAGWGLTNTGLFDNIQTGAHYWFGLEYEPNNEFFSWSFSANGGYQIWNGKSINFHGWAVHSGDVGAALVPIPASIWLFGSGLLGLVGMARRNA